MAAGKILILRCLAERGLEGRTVLIQPIVDFLTASKSGGPGEPLRPGPWIPASAGMTM
jgi:hypothetical protein